MRRTFIFLAMILIFASANIVKAQLTTSSMNGVVYGTNNETLPGATVVAVHNPTGSKFATTTDMKGFFRMANMNVGGPYTITVTFVGFKENLTNNIYLSLGQAFKLSVKMAEKSTVLTGVEVTARKNDIFDGNRTGAETYIGANEIKAMPSISRDLSDFTRLTPQASNYGGGVSVAGVNNRYNSIFIDGAVNNDVFGLTSSGTNGGQTGISPISMDAIEQFQVSVAPYDIKQSGFAGAGINAVTKSGTNEFKGTGYYFFRNENFAGTSPDSLQTKYDPFSNKSYGISVGGPIIKNKLFFFFNAEQQRNETPNPYNFATYEGNMKNKRDTIDLLVNKIKSYGYDPGTFENSINKTYSDKFLFRIDYNINKNHKLTIRHSYTKGEAIYPYQSQGKTQIVFYNNWVNFVSTTNSTAIELKSNFGNRFANNLILGYTTVNDDRNPNGSNFPYVSIKDGSGYIVFGSERYSSANSLKQDIFTLTDNLEIYKGKHTFTFGTHNEFYKMYNLFIRDNFGNYQYNSVLDFLQNKNATYSRSYSLVDNVTGDGTAAAADFKAMQLGFYAQDEYEMNSRFKITAGLRVDIPVFQDDPIAINGFDTTLAKISAAGYNLEGAKSGQMPKSQIMFSPRIGFNYDINGDKSLQLRGGIGIFTSRVPLVWPAGAYTNCGMIVGGISGKQAVLRPDWNNQYVASDFGSSLSIPSGEINLFSQDFKFPQVLRASLGLDKKLPWWGLIGSVEAIYTKTINNINYFNVNMKPSVKTLNGGADFRPIYQGNISPNLIENAYTGIYLAKNTSEGYSYNFTVQLEKPISKGFAGSIAYTLGHSKGLNDGTSSQNSSQWRYTANVNGRNRLDLAYTNFDMGSRVVAFISYKKEYKKYFASSIGIYYNGQSGNRYSYVYEDGYKMTNEDYKNDQDLIFVPANQTQIELKDYTVSGVTVTAAQQWANLEQFINNDEYLKSRKGKYAERNGARLPFDHDIDIRFSQDFYFFIAGKKNTLQLSFDIQNFANLLNHEWGRSYYITNGTYPLVKFEGFKNNDGVTPQFTFRKPGDIDVASISSSGSRWLAQFGIRYIF